MPNELFKLTEDENKPLTRAQEKHIDATGDEARTLIHNPMLDRKVKIQQFNAILNRQPPRALVRTLNGVLYLPIRYHKRLMQQLFLGQTKSEVISYMPIFNEITLHLRLWYLHPITGEWLHDDGVGAVPIMQDANTKVAEFAMHKKANALVTCLPKCKTEAYKNATKELGTIFGSDLNRKILPGEGDYDAGTNTVKTLNA